MNPKKRIGEMLIEAGIIDETQLKAALGHQRQWGVRLGQALVDLKLATEAEIVGALAVKYGFGVAELEALEPYGLEQALSLLPREFAFRNNVFPMAADSGSVTVAMSDPTNLAVVDEIRFRTGRKVKVCIGGDREVAEALARHYPGEAPVEAIALDLEADEAQADAVFDPFGGGSKDALEAFFSSAGEAPAAGTDGEAVAGPPPPAPAPAGPPPAPPSAPRPAATRTPPAPPPAPARPGRIELELEEPARAPAPESGGTAEFTLTDEVTGSGLLIPEQAEGRPPASGPAAPAALTPRQAEVLHALERLAGGAHAEPEILKPAQAMASLALLLVRKGVVTEEELLRALAGE
jgi:hypothetical protein